MLPLVGLDSWQFFNAKLPCNLELVKTYLFRIALEFVVRFFIHIPNDLECDIGFSSLLTYFQSLKVAI